MSQPAPASAPVAGVDGWPGGWVVAISAPDGIGEETLHIVEDMEAVVTVTRDCQVIGVDMPMALPQHGVRVSDADLRAWLGPAGRSLFYTPTRAALAASTHAEAVTINKAGGGKGPSAQGWGLANKIREVRAALGPDPDPRFAEVHPESSFLMMHRLRTNDHAPPDQTPLSSKRSARGVGERIALLQAAGFSPAAMLASCAPGPKVDDVLDAMAAGWSAARIATGNATWFGPRERDDQGFCPGVAV